MPYPSFGKTLLILLGASHWKHHSELDSEAFANSASDVKKYFIELGLDSENWLDLFNTDRDPDEIDREIEIFCDRRQEAMEAVGRRIENIIIYYIGHGELLGRNSELCLLIRSTRKKSLGVSSIRISDLANVLTKKGRYLRCYMILDCCFAGAAVFHLQNDDLAAVAIGTIETYLSSESLPQKGLALLCSSSERIPSRISSDHTYTLFTNSFLEALRQGCSHSTNDHLSLREITDLTNQILRTIQDAPLANLHSPKQEHGDITMVPLFFNPASKAKRGTHLKRSFRKNQRTAKNDESSKKAKKDGRKTEQKLDSIIKEHDPIKCYERGLDLVSSERYEEALLAFEQAIQLNNRYAAAYNRKGDILLELWKDYEALAAFDQAIQLDPEYAEAYLNRGRAQDNLRNDAEALKDYQHAIDLEAEDDIAAAAYYNIGLILFEDKEDHQGALSAIEQSLELEPERVEAYYYRACLLEFLKKYEEALDAYNKAMRKALDVDLELYIDVLYGKGCVLLELNNPREALYCYQKIEEHYPDDVDTLFNKGRALIQLKDYEKALEAYNHVILLEPKYSVAHYNKGIALERLERLEESMNSYNDCIALDPTYTNAYYGKAAIFNNQGDHEKALQIYNQMIKLSLDLPKVQKTRKELMRHMGL